MKISDIIKSDEYIFSDVDGSTCFNSITANANHDLKDKILFIPNSSKIPTLRQENRPIAIICEEDAAIPEGFPAIRVKSARNAWAYAAYRRENMDLSKIKLIGITGTNGKTSTATYIKRILSTLGKRVGFIGTGNIEIDGKRISSTLYSMTTPDPDLLYPTLKAMKKAECEYIVMEVSSHALALKKIAPLIFDYGIFTNLSSEHMDFHGSVESYFEAKCGLFSQCKNAIFNIDNAWCRRAYEACEKRKISVGALWRGDVFATEIHDLGFNGVNYFYHGKGFLFKLNLKTPGIYNVYNSMLAAALCIDMGCKPCDVKNALSKVYEIPGRFEIINGEITVIIDYAHTDAALESFLSSVDKMRGTRDLTVIFGCGGNRDKQKRPRMAAVAEKYAKRVIVTSDNSRNENPNDIINDIVCGFEGKDYKIIEDRREAILDAVFSASSGDIVAIVGKGCEKYNIDKQGYHDFDERKIVEEALLKRASLPENYENKA